MLYAAKIVALAGVYYGAAKLGLELAFETNSVTAVWPPTGIALAALVLGGYRLWPGVALGAFLANSWTGIPVYAVLGITVGNTLEALVGTLLLRRVAGFRPSLERVTDVLALVGLAGVLSTVISATLGVSSLLAAGEISSDSFGSVWRTWWLGDLGGDLVVAPAILVAVTHWPFRQAGDRPLEATAVALLAAAVAVLVFTQSANLTFLAYPILIWACLRFRQLGAVTVCLLLAGVAIPLTAGDHGPFSGNPPDDRLLLAQTYVGVASITALVLAAVVTERRRVEGTLRGIATTLQESLLPHPPDIPGVEVAVDFRPAGEGQLVGGDFYDWFPNEDGSWAVAIGDVAGKGAPAAATAALARYTLRAAAMHERQPSRILDLLNEAVMRQSPGQTCTVAYARIEFDQVGGGRMTLAVAGHPPPLVLRSRGEVEAVGRGTLLGASESPNLTDYHADLRPGDALVFHTDGLTDAYAPGYIVSPAELNATVRSSAGRSAGGIVERIAHAVLHEHGAKPRDDILLLVIRMPGQRREPPRAWLRRGPSRATSRALR
jgi:integral membrane sensor domain MASE1